MRQQAIVCGNCKTINYRLNELTCRSCHQYFPTKTDTLVPPRLNNDVFAVAGVATMVATIAGTTAVVLTWVISSVMM